MLHLLFCLSPSLPILRAPRCIPLPQILNSKVIELNKQQVLNRMSDTSKKNIAPYLQSFKMVYSCSDYTLEAKDGKIYVNFKPKSSNLNKKFLNELNKNLADLDFKNDSPNIINGF